MARRSYNPHRITLTERLAFAMPADKKKVRMLRQKNKGILPQQRPLIVTTFQAKSDKPLEPTMSWEERFKIIRNTGKPVSKTAHRIQIGDKVESSVGLVGTVTKSNRDGLYVCWTAGHGDNFYPNNQLCHRCKMIFASNDILSLHRSAGHKRRPPYINWTPRKQSKSEIIWEEQQKERRLAYHSTGEDTFDRIVSEE